MVQPACILQAKTHELCCFWCDRGRPKSAVSTLQRVSSAAAPTSHTSTVRRGLLPAMELHACMYAFKPLLTLPFLLHLAVWLETDLLQRLGVHQGPMSSIHTESACMRPDLVEGQTSKHSLATCAWLSVCRVCISLYEWECAIRIPSSTISASIGTPGRASYLHQK